MKCLRKLSIFSKLLVIGLLLLVLALPLSAWSFYAGEAENVELISRNRNTIAELEAEIAAKVLIIEQQEMQLSVFQTELEAYQGSNNELENTVMQLREDLKKSKLDLKAYENLIAKIKEEQKQLEIEISELVESSTSSSVDEVLKQRLAQVEADSALLREQLVESRITTAKIQSDLEAAMTLSELSEAEYQELLDKVDQYDQLQDAYDIAFTEGQQYYQDLVNAKADNNGFNGFLGSSATYNPDSGDIGVNVIVGLGVGKIMLTLGADYDIGTPLDYKTLTYSAGVALRF